MTDHRIRRIEPGDIAAVVGLVHELAAYERAPGECRLSEAQLRAALFGDRVAVHGHVGEVDGVVVACALWFGTFSTWRGVPGIYLEDLFVQPGHRGRGLGRALLAALAGECAEHGYARLEWSVLNWNEPAIGFYRALGAVAQDDWTVLRLTGDALSNLARS